MFKLTKILNSGVNVAEGCYMPATADTDYVIGSAAKLTDGALVNAAATDIPTFIIGENASANSKNKVFCYHVSPDMIFETQISESPAQISVGDKVTLSLTDGSACGVTATTTGGVAEIYDMAGASAAGDTVFVRIPA